MAINWEKAILKFSQAVVNWQALVKRAELCMKLERFDDAVRDYSSLKDLDPANKGGLTCLHGSVVLWHLGLAMQYTMP